MGGTKCSRDRSGPSGETNIRPHNSPMESEGKTYETAWRSYRFDPEGLSTPGNCAYRSAQTSFEQTDPIKLRLVVGDELVASLVLSLTLASSCAHRSVVNTPVLTGERSCCLS